MQKPSFWRLVGAYSIDFLLLIVVGSLIGYLVSLATTFFLFVMWNGKTAEWILAGGVIAFMGVVLLYFSILENSFGQTLGKKLMGLQVVQREEIK